MPNWEWDGDHEREGWFWLAGADARFYGRLRHTAPNGPHFHFFDVPGVSTRLSDPIPWGSCIHGELAGGRPVTLEPFWPAQTQISAAPRPTTTVDGFAGTVFIGAHISPGVSVRADTLAATLHGLDPTAMGVAGDQGLLNPYSGSRPGSVSGGEAREFQLHDGSVLILDAGQSGTTGRTGVHLEAHAGMRIIAPSEIAIDELEGKYVEPMRELVVFCTRGPSYVQTLSFESSSDPVARIDVLRRPWPAPSKRDTRQQPLVLNLARVSDPDEVVSGWLKLRATVGPVWPSFFSILCADELLESRFLNMMAFMEGYHRAVRDRPPLTVEQERIGRHAIKAALDDVAPPVRNVFWMRIRHANSQTQKERLADLAADVKAVLRNRWSFDPKHQARAMVDTRNWMTHWGSRTKHVDDTPEGIFSFYRQLEVIGYVAILRDLQLSQDEIFSAITHGWLNDNLLN